MIDTLTIKQLTVSLEKKIIIHDVNIHLKQGSLHVLMGPNGSGKSTLALALMGYPTYTVSGTILLNGIDITDLAMHKRAQAGLFITFQQPQEIPGVSIATFLKAAYEALHEPISVDELQQRVLFYMDLLAMDQALLYRNLHEGFSGGEKKKLELLQLLMFKPKVAILDEIDSGLDVDALAVVAEGIKQAQKENPEMSIVLITHYQRILAHMQPDVVHVLKDGRLIASGDITVAQQIDQLGYDGLLQ